LEEGTSTKQTEIPEWAGVPQDHHETKKKSCHLGGIYKNYKHCLLS